MPPTIPTPMLPVLGTGAFPVNGHALVAVFGEGFQAGEVLLEGFLFGGAVRELPGCCRDFWGRGVSARVRGGGI